MKKDGFKTITVVADINSDIRTVWNLWTDPRHIIHWNNASDDWQTTIAEIDLREGGRFRSRMEARDGSMGFDFTGKYTKVDLHRTIESLLDDNRKVKVVFEEKGSKTKISETFDAEEENSLELQKTGWQAILDNFKNYVEKSGKMEIMHFEVAINSNVEKVYKTLIDDKKYSEWTSEFNPDSHFKGSWNKGSKILFIGTDQEGKTGGMVSRIREHIPNRFVSIEHLGVVKEGKEITTGPEVDMWGGALENYTFTAVNDTTILSVDIDSVKEFKTYFSETWPRALNKLKSICETKNKS